MDAKDGEKEKKECLKTRTTKVRPTSHAAILSWAVQFNNVELTINMGIHWIYADKKISWKRGYLTKKLVNKQSTNRLINQSTQLLVDHIDRDIRLS